MTSKAKFLSLIAFLGATFLFSCQNNNSKAGNAADANKSGESGVKIAYINIDSFNAHFDLVSEKDEMIKKAKEEFANKLKRNKEDLERQAVGIQSKAQGMNQRELGEAQNQLAMLQSSFEGLQQNYSEQLMKIKDSALIEINTKLDSFIAKYNKEKNYDFIFTYSEMQKNGMLYGKKQYDITKEFIEAINADYKKNKK